MSDQVSLSAVLQDSVSETWNAIVNNIEASIPELVNKFGAVGLVIGTVTTAAFGLSSAIKSYTDATATANRFGIENVALAREQSLRIAELNEMSRERALGLIREAENYGIATKDAEQYINASRILADLTGTTLSKAFKSLAEGNSEFLEMASRTVPQLRDIGDEALTAADRVAMIESAAGDGTSFAQIRAEIKAIGDEIAEDIVPASETEADLLGTWLGYLRWLRGAVDDLGDFPLTWVWSTQKLLELWTDLVQLIQDLPTHTARAMQSLAGFIDGLGPIRGPLGFGASEALRQGAESVLFGASSPSRLASRPGTNPDPFGGGGGGGLDDESLARRAETRRIQDAFRDRRAVEDLIDSYIPHESMIQDAMDEIERQQGRLTERMGEALTGSEIEEQLALLPEISERELAKMQEIHERRLREMAEYEATVYAGTSAGLSAMGQEFAGLIIDGQNFFVAIGEGFRSLTTNLVAFFVQLGTEAISDMVARSAASSLVSAGLSLIPGGSVAGAAAGIEQPGSFISGRNLGVGAEDVARAILPHVNRLQSEGVGVG